MILCVLSDDFGATDFVKKNSRAVGQKIGKHWQWKSIGEYGWCKASIPEADHIGLIRVNSWLLCTKPPTIHESSTDFRSRREREKMARIQVILEQAQMESEDMAWCTGVSRVDPDFAGCRKCRLHARLVGRRSCAGPTAGPLRAKHMQSTLKPLQANTKIMEEHDIGMISC